MSVESIRFHARHAWFNLHEQFGDLPGAVAANALIPFFVWILSRVWERFNAGLGHFTLSEVVVYIGLTELLFMTFVRPNSIGRASGDFSIALARPRSWLMMSFSGLIGRSLGGRLVILAILAFALPLLGASVSDTASAFLRFSMLLPWLMVLQGLMALFFAIAQVLWHQTDYFLMPVGKVFLVLGGVWGPLADFNEPWRTFLLKLPPSDLFFQPAYYCVKGRFFQVSEGQWLGRTLLIAVVLAVLNLWFFRVAKVRHQSLGG